MSSYWLPHFIYSLDERWGDKYCTHSGSNLFISLLSSLFSFHIIVTSLTCRLLTIARAIHPSAFAQNCTFLSSLLICVAPVVFACSCPLFPSIFSTHSPAPHSLHSIDCASLFLSSCTLWFVVTFSHTFLDLCLWHGQRKDEFTLRSVSPVHFLTLCLSHCLLFHSLQSLFLPPFLFMYKCVSVSSHGASLTHSLQPFYYCSDSFFIHSYTWLIHLSSDSIAFAHMYILAHSIFFLSLSLSFFPSLSPYLILSPSPSLFGIGGRELPSTERQKIYPNGTLMVTEATRELDEGTYVCRAVNDKGEQHSREFHIQVLSELHVFISFHFCLTFIVSLCAMRGAGMKKS